MYDLQFIYISFTFFSSVFMKFRFRELRGRVGNCLSSFYWARTLLPPTEQLSRSVCARGSPCICIWNAPCGMSLVHDKAVNWLFNCARDPQKAVSFRHTRPARRNTSRIPASRPDSAGSRINLQTSIMTYSAMRTVHYPFIIGTKNCGKFSLLIDSW